MRFLAGLFVLLAALLLLAVAAIFVLAPVEVVSEDAPRAVVVETPHAPPAPGLVEGEASAAPRATEPSAPASVEALAGEDARREAPSAARAADEQGLGHVIGQVLDWDGTPAPGADVRILGKRGFSMLPPDATTGADGRFAADLGLQRKKTMRLRVTRKDRLPLTVDDVVFRRDRTTDVGAIRFAPSAALDVTVLDASSRPVPNARVTLEYEGKESPRVTPPEGAEGMEAAASMVDAALEIGRLRGATGEDGVARFAALPVGLASVRIAPWTSGFGMRSARRASSATATPAEEPDASELGPVTRTVELVAGRRDTLEITLRGLGTLTGRATVHGAPFANGWLGLSRPGPAATMFTGFEGNVRTRTDAEGRFTFPPVPPGSYALRRGDPGPSLSPEDMATDGDMSAMGQRFLEMMSRANQGADADRARPVEIGEGTTRADVEFGGSMVEVLVQDEGSGQAIAHATVRLFDVREADPALAELPGASGPFGRFVRDLASTSDTPVVRLRGSADAKGRAEFRDLRPGKYRLVARADERPPSAPVDLTVGEDVFVRAVAKVPLGTTITGTVNDAHGNALERAMVVALVDEELEPAFPNDLSFVMGPPKPTASTDTKGAFVLKGVAHGPRRIAAMAPGFAPASLSTSAPSEGNHLFLAKPGSIRVTVRRDGKPAHRAVVEIDTEAEDAPVPAEALRLSAATAFMRFEFPTFTAFTDESGIATLRYLPPGEWTVRVSSFASLATAAPEPPVDGAVAPVAPPKRPEPVTRRVVVVAEQETSATVELR